MKGVLTTFATGIALALGGALGRFSLNGALSFDRVLLRLFPNQSSMILFHMAKLHDHAGNATEALGCLELGRTKALDSSPFDIESARIAELNGDYAEAARQYERLLASSNELGAEFRSAVNLRLQKFRKTPSQ
jgi:hypothetical protein